MIIVNNLTGNDHFVGTRKFKPGEHEFDSLPEVVLNSLKNSVNILVKDLTDVLKEDEVPPTADEMASASGEFERLDSVTAGVAKLEIVELTNKALLRLLSQKAQFITVRRAAQDRLKLLEEQSNAPEKPNG